MWGDLCKRVGRGWDLRPPRRCLLCCAWARQALCEACLRLHGDGHVPGARPRCPGCGLRLALGVSRCAGCEREPPAHGRVQVAVDYAHPWDRVMLEFKFGARPEHAAALALLMAQGVRQQAAAEPDQAALPTRLVPVPLSRERLAQRGYNQAWELTRQLARQLGVNARADALTRPVHLAGQAEQDRPTRLKRLRGVFQVSASGRAWVAGHRLGLVDDVLTTGATAAEAARTLMAAGAAEVQVWAFARTPAPEEGPS
ncbi:MAG: ComF family protein [Betaproteobacteria bacterium]|nr:ComF family protein [Betaproteobacteria bacterium]NBU50293.1 ComF family protein [Betaproteobacteria bacterium]NBX95856.1 ComF family protein [Betaproteobacteria bacterium]